MGIVKFAELLTKQDDLFGRSGRFIILEMLISILEYTPREKLVIRFIKKIWRRKLWLILLALQPMIMGELHSALHRLIADCYADSASRGKFSQIHFFEKNIMPRFHWKSVALGMALSHPEFFPRHNLIIRFLWKTISLNRNVTNM